VVPNANLDREQTRHIILTVEASDCPNTPLQRQYDFATVSSFLLFAFDFV